MELLSLNELIESFHKIFKMRVSVYNSQFHSIMSYPEQISSFCRDVHKHRECHSICQKSDLKAFAAAAEQKVIQSYICPFGLHEFAAPIIINNNVVGYILTGQVIAASKAAEDFTIETACVHYPQSEERFAALVSMLPHLTADEIETCRRILTILIHYIETNQIYHFEQKSLGKLVKSYINRNLESRITLDGIAFALYCSPAAITKAFRKEFGISVMQYVMTKRLKYAKQLLTNSKLPIKEISLQCGFSDSGYFTKCFTSTFMISPTQWRKNEGGTDV